METPLRSPLQSLLDGVPTQCEVLHTPHVHARDTKAFNDVLLTKAVHIHPSAREIIDRVHAIHTIPAGIPYLAKTSAMPRALWTSGDAWHPMYTRPDEEGSYVH